MSDSANKVSTEGRYRGLKPYTKGQSGNLSGRPPTDPLFRKRCRQFVDEHVVDAWCQEVRERGEKWLEASKLLAAYGYGIPKDTATEEQMRTIEGESSVTPARALQALDDAPLTPEPRGPDDSDH